MGVGFKVKKTTLPKDEFNVAMVAGNFIFAFSETWGPPYDPHSYAKSWSTTDEAYYAALKGLKEPNTQTVLNQKIDNVLKEENAQDRQDKWSEILNILHSSATELPLSGKRIPAVINKRLSNYQNGLQQFDYPVHTLRIQSGSENITVAPGGQTGLFAGVGRLDPHTYRPNEFFANNWVYDGLVEYGQGGTILPSLATSWTVDGSGKKYSFTLRSGVKFHDGAVWNCTVAKMNFDNVFASPLRTPDWHGWYGLPLQISGWTCNGNTFEITTTDKYYPLLQELTYIRPLRMLSPTKFVGGYNNNPLTENSCHVGWGSATHEGVTVNCAGITGISGTGRWKYVTTIFNEFGNVTNEVLFERNTDHWDPVPNNAAKFMRLIRYDDHAAVTAALKSGTLDLVVGADVLTPSDIKMFQADHTNTHQVYLTEPLQNRIVIINTAKAPTDDIKVRKAMIHAVNKAAIVEKELGVLGRPVNGLFPITAPYCDVDLTPTWDYDLEKAELLNCPNNSDPVTPVTESTESKKKSSPDNIGIIVFLIILVVVALIGIACMIKREKAGRPIFKPLIEIDNIKTEGTVNN